ncbi:MAG: pseudouridine synthase [Planctomycetota bacterium]
MVFAHQGGAARLSESFRSHITRKRYVALVPGRLREATGELHQWLRKDPARNTSAVVPEGSAGAKAAVTSWRVLAFQAGQSLVELHPHTGRPHQLRMAMATLAGPIEGDLRYGARLPLPDKSIALHALALSVPHPTRTAGDGPEILRLRAPLPAGEWWNWARDFLAQEEAADGIR